MVTIKLLITCLVICLASKIYMNYLEYYTQDLDINEIPINVCFIYKIVTSLFEYSFVGIALFTLILVWKYI